MEVVVQAYTLTSALGAGLHALRDNLRAGRGGLSDAAWPDSSVPCYLGRVAETLLEVPAERASRNNRLVATALAQDDFAARVAATVDQYGAARVGLVMGTSTSSIDRTEAGYHHLDEADRFPEAYRQPLTHNPHAPGHFAAAHLGLQGPVVTVSAACASSAKVYAVAERWLAAGVVDAVVVGGVDSLCLSVIYGFHSLQLVAEEACRPFDANRTGISLGEAGGFALLCTEARPDGSGLRIAGVGESCDAYHMSSAHPDGLGARLSMQRALAAAGITAGDLDYVNLHGTGTRANDSTEADVCADLLGSDVPMSATKSWTGHTLGAAGMVETILCMEAMARGFLPATLQTSEVEGEINLLLDNTPATPDYVLSNSFGFGGNNCSVVLGRL